MRTAAAGAVSSDTGPGAPHGYAAAVMARSRGTNLIAFLAATLVALALFRGATAQAQGAPYVALVPHGGGVAALGADGQVVHVARSGGSRRLARGLDGEVLVACGERLLAVDASGVLVEIGGRFGPPVSLHATPLCLDDGAVLAIDPDGRRLLRLDPDLRVVGAASLQVLPDAEPVLLADGSVAMPTSPTFRYPHGVLGDAVESAGLAIVDPVDLSVLARWEAPNDQVIEQRRLAAFPAAGRRGLVATLSGAGDGGALAVLAQRDGDAEQDDEHEDDAHQDAAPQDAGALAVVARAAGLGIEMRWRHVVGIRDRRLYTVATPHIGGPLERWTLDREAHRLRREAFDLDVTSHRIGRRELDLGRLLPRADGDGEGLDLLVFPDRTLRSLRLVACDAGGCRTTAELPLAAPLATAPWTERDVDGRIFVWAADMDGGLQRLAFPRDGIPTNQE